MSFFIVYLRIPSDYILHHRAMKKFYQEAGGAGFAIYYFLFEVFHFA